MLSAIRTVHIATEPIDMRRSFDGLLASARHLGLDPYQGCCVVFLSRSRLILKAVLGDAKGIVLICRRFEGGRLPKLVDGLLDPKVKVITQAQMLLLFEGCTFHVSSEVPPWKPVPSP